MSGASINIFGRVRQMLQGIDQASVGDVEQIALNEQLEQIVSFGTAPYGEIVRMGRAFEVHTTAAAAAVVAVPTTGNMLSLWSGEADNGRAIIIDRVWALMAVGTAAAGQAALLGALGQTKVASLTSAALAINPLNGFGSRDTKVVNSTGALDAVTGVAANWRVLPGQTGGQKVGAGATPGVYINCEVNGRIILPPGRLFAVSVLADLVGSTFTVGIEWHEKTVKLG